MLAGKFVVNNNKDHYILLLQVCDTAMILKHGPDYLKLYEQVKLSMQCHLA